jgi:hypothetical protein
MDAMKPYWRMGLEAMVRDGVADGTFRKELNVAQVTTALMALLSGASAYGEKELDETETAVEQWLLAPEIQSKGEQK